MNAREQSVPSASVVRFASGDRDAFVEVYRAFAAPLRRWVARFFKSPFEQEEAVQEAWLTVHRMHKSYDVNKGELGPWLRTVAANRCREILRARGRRPDASVPLEDVDEALWLEGPGLGGPAPIELEGECEMTAAEGEGGCSDMMMICSKGREEKEGVGFHENLDSSSSHGSGEIIEAAP